MEEELLQGMIRDRETQIKLIENKLEEQKKKMERTQLQRVQVEQLLQSQKVQHIQELEAIRKQLKTVQRDYRQSKESLDMKKQQQQQQQHSPTPSGSAALSGPSLHVYNDIMKAVATPESNDSSYVLRMQAQLCKAMHSMGMLENQLQLQQQQQDSVQRSLKEVITNMVEEKSQIELKLMNDLVVADNFRREAEAKLKAEAEAFIKQKDDLMEKIERQNEQEENDEEPEEEDEEEKEELKEILTQGREEIERLMQENSEQEKILEDLKQKVAMAKGQDIMEEIVTSIAEEFKEREEQDNDDEEDEDED
ncbi:hypothetical protein IV203_002021 [Nitzschia inconspicua]|uniref:Uncharacterized protein n=1 Tax=Nitzschia inconspicua TaxID=303405 RepID=A0A9K3L9J6_9STRA|nr:hypothetical protein IV203_002021 [Nitzschia inconspicua]